ncbi:hypothetical protein EVAR_74511_1 [Eumeta japonica]|uniref:Uncharacterized protein n=1 Tax=Eumeta variegata TaxID=151549 RepID=A0A4C1TBH0_EUMVA|nr:hypothetical protein EVAR_74511_1 [Eumeta japonica]
MHIRLERESKAKVRLVAENFLRNKRNDIYAELTKNILSSFRKMGCNTALKIHFLHSHSDFLPDNCGAFMCYGEHFHQDIVNMEKRCERHWNVSMLADYCCTVCRDITEAECKRAATKQHRSSPND